MIWIISLSLVQSGSQSVFTQRCETFLLSQLNNSRPFCGFRSWSFCWNTELRQQY